MPEPSQMLADNASASNLALFLDFDGTLAEIAETPDAVVLDPSLPSVLARLRDRLGGALAIISGRPIAFLDRSLGVRQVRRCRIARPRIPHRRASIAVQAGGSPRPAAGVAQLQEKLGVHQGLILEDKGCSVAVHWRLVPEHANFATDIARSFADMLGPAYRIQYGKAVAEILPATSGKGQVIETFLEEQPYRGRRPVFIGDDLTDENGFEAVNHQGGFSIRIGEGETVARRRLASPADLRRCLAHWAESDPFDWTRWHADDVSRSWPSSEIA